jgi:predicted DNA-binding protein (UPF0251 family)
MRIIKAGLTGLKAPNLVAKSAHVEEAMTDNVHFATPTPAIADLTAARIALTEAIIEAQRRASAAIATKNEAAKTMARLITALSRYVNSATSDVAIAVTSGFGLAKQPDPVDHLEAPTNYVGSRGTIAGEVKLRWKGVRGARMYQTYICEGDPYTDGVWKPVGMSSKATITIPGLITDKLYSFKTAALGVVGEGPLSEIATAKAA